MSERISNPLKARMECRHEMCGESVSLVLLGIAAAVALAANGVWIVGLVVGAIFIAGSRLFGRKWYCSICGNPVSNGGVKQCPHCWQNRDARFIPPQDYDRDPLRINKKP